jgi:hypothetical protein
VALRCIRLPATVRSKGQRGVIFHLAHWVPLLGGVVQKNLRRQRPRSLLQGSEWLRRFETGKAVTPRLISRSTWLSRTQLSSTKLRTSPNSSRYNGSAA